MQNKRKNRRKSDGFYNGVKAQKPIQDKNILYYLYERENKNLLLHKNYFANKFQHYAYLAEILC